jgi:hypothetical protein
LYSLKNGKNSILNSIKQTLILINVKRVISVKIRTFWLLSKKTLR